jgi:hypothetical protein
MGRSPDMAACKNWCRKWEEELENQNKKMQIRGISKPYFWNHF